MKIDPVVIERILTRAIEVQQVPAPTFEEGERAEFVRRAFEQEGLGHVSVDELGNVYACLAGEGDGRPIVLSAHTDTVFPMNTDLSISRDGHQISGPGIGDNSLGVAGLFGVLWALREAGEQLPGDLWLVANVGEEGLGDLKGMRAVVDRFGEAPLAYIVLEGMALGRVFHRGLGGRRYRITARAKGGHSWVDYGRPSAIYALTDLIQALRELPLPQTPRTTLSVGLIEGGTSVNTIPATASLALDLRSVGERELEILAQAVEDLVEALSTKDVKLRCEVIGDRPVGKISEDHPLVQMAIQALLAQGIEADLNVGSTDANIPLSRGLPAICVGLALGGGAHTVDEYVRTDVLALGIVQLIMLLRAAFSLT